MLIFSCDLVNNSEEINSEKLSEQQQRIGWINCGVPHTQQNFKATLIRMLYKNNE